MGLCMLLSRAADEAKFTSMIGTSLHVCFVCMFGATYLGAKCADPGVVGLLQLLASVSRLDMGVTTSSGSSLPTLPTSEILCGAGVLDCPASLATSAKIRAMLPGAGLVLMFARPDTGVGDRALFDSSTFATSSGMLKCSDLLAASGSACAI